MNLEQHENIIENSFVTYETIQSDHLSILRNKEMPDLGTMTREREEAFSTLKNNLDNLIGNAGSIGGTKSLPLLSRFETRLNTIMGLDEQIGIEIQRHRVDLKKHLKHMKQGKAAMKGYRPSGTSPNQSHVLSMNR